MVIRLAFALVAASVCLSSVFAQSALLPSTVAMRDMSQALYRDLQRMTRGEDPFNQAKAEAAMAKLIDVGGKLAAAFPESSKGKTSPETRYSASPKVWTSKAEFNAQIEKFNKVLQDNRGKVQSLDELKAAYPAINDTCNGCHEGFRLRRS